MPDLVYTESTVGISLSGDALLTYKSGGGFLPARTTALCRSVSNR